MNTKQKAKIEKILTSPDGTALIKTALKSMLEFWNAKRDIEDLLVAETNGIIDDDFGIDDLFNNLGASGADEDIDNECLASFVSGHVECL